MDTTVYILSEKNTGSYCIPPCKRSINMLRKDFFCCLEMEKYINFPDRGLRQSASSAVITNRAKLLFISHRELMTHYNHLFSHAVHTHRDTVGKLKKQLGDQPRTRAPLLHQVYR